MKRLMIGALVALSAILLLPVLASATPAHVSPAPEGAFPLHGGASEWSRVAGGATTSTTTTGSGTFDNTTTGRLKLIFHGVKSSIGTNCQTAGQPTGTIVTTELTFHLIMIETNVPGILITGGPTPGDPAWGHHFFDYGCGIFIPTIQWKGSGLIGTITAPSCGQKSNTATVSFQAQESGVQKHRTWTGNTYDLESSIGGGEYSTSAIQAHATITFAGGQTPELICTH